MVLSSLAASFAGGGTAASGAPAQETAVTRTVCGLVRKVTCDNKGSGLTTIELKPRSKEGAVTIRRGDRIYFTPRPEDQYRETDICATGRVEGGGKRRVLVVSRPDDIAIRSRLAPPPAPWEGTYFTACDEGLVMPVLVNEVRPSYTREAMAALIQGVVGLQAMIGADGSIGEIRILKSLDPTYGLDRQAVAALRQWRFKPGTRDGQPVPVLVEIEMSFRLR